MGQPYGKFKFDIGDKITTNGRNLEIIDRKYIPKTKHKSGKSYIQNSKWYLYRCLDCKNEDWIVEYSLIAKRPAGCNVCCYPPKKIVKGINDVTAKQPWMIKYFKHIEDAETNTFASKKIVEMVCPYCGREKKQSICNLYTNKGLSCTCRDTWSYPNKFMYAFLEQCGVNFTTEKTFPWSDNRVYDDCIDWNGTYTLIENHGIQHYTHELKRGRTVSQEKTNDIYKKILAFENGIRSYYEIDCRESDMEYIKNSIITSGLIKHLGKTEQDIDWNKCEEFAMSNLAKQVCDYKKDNPTILLKDIAEHFRISYCSVLRFVKAGSKFGWCDYHIFDDYKYLKENNLMRCHDKPIHCITNDTYHRSARAFATEYEELYGKKLQNRNIRHVCNGKRNHVNNLQFEYITQEQFNTIKKQSPELVHGDFFVI